MVFPFARQGTGHECEQQQWFVLLAESYKATGNAAYMAWAISAACEADNDVSNAAPQGMCLSPAKTIQTADAAPAPQESLPHQKKCRQVFVPPADPDGSGYMQEECD